MCPAAWADTVTSSSSPRKPVPLHRLQAHPPGLPHLCQGKWWPQDISGPARKAAQLGGMPRASGLQRREIRWPGGRSFHWGDQAWAMDAALHIWRGVLINATGAFFPPEKAWGNWFLEQAWYPRADFLQGISAWQPSVETSMLST